MLLIRTLTEIYEGMLDAFAEKSGFRPSDSCDMAVRLYAAAAQLQSLEAQAEWTLAQAFPQTAQGEYLDYHGSLRNLSRKPPLSAQGSLRFSIPAALAQDLLIPANTACLHPSGSVFLTKQEAILTAGDTFVDVPAVAQEAGLVGNVAPNTITAFTLAPIGIQSCTNPQAFSGGQDAESDEDFRSRILLAYAQISNGANCAFYEQQTKNFPAVAAASVLRCPRGQGTVDVIVSAWEGIPSDALLAEIQADLQSQREIAVDVQVIAPVAIPLSVSAVLTVAEGYDPSMVCQQAEASLRAFFNGMLLGQSITRAKLGFLLYQVEGVENYQLSMPVQDVPISSAELPVLHSLSITV